MPYYPVYLTKTQQRNWHRPKIRFQTDEVITFDGLKKKMESKKDKAARTLNKSPSEVMKTTRDLTLAEKGKFVLLEFSVSIWNCRGPRG
jgi:transcription initiation factor TFIID subunit 1, fungi type